MPDPSGGAWERLASAVARSARGHGVGARLVEEAARRAARGGFDRMELSVHPDNATAIRFYEGIGWRKIVAAGGWTGRMWRPVPTEPRASTSP